MHRYGVRRVVQGWKFTQSGNHMCVQKVVMARPWLRETQHQAAAVGVVRSSFMNFKAA